MAVRTECTFTLKIDCTASLISVFVALGATWNTSVFWSSLIARPFSVITGRRIIWYADFIFLGYLRRFVRPRPPPRSRRRFLRAFVFVFAGAGLVLPLRDRFLQRHLQLLDRRMRKNHAVVLQQVIGMHFGAAHQFEPVNIARAQFQVAILVFRGLDDQNCLVDFESAEGFAEFLGLRFLHVEGINDDQFSVGQLRGQCRAQRAQQLFARESVVIGTRLRTMHGVAMPPQRRADRADAGASRALLFPELFARSGNLPTALGLVRALVLPGAVMLDRFPEQIFVDRAENLVGQIERPHFGSA